MTPVYRASTAELLSTAESVATAWQRIGTSGSFLARELHTGRELGFDVDTALPLASVVKVPIALVALDRIAEGTLDPAQPVTIDPADKSVGPTGVSAFRYPATLAIADLVHQMLTVSDNASADTVLDLLGLDAVEERLREWDCAGITVRHRMNRMYECAAGIAGENSTLALELAIREESSLEPLDPAHANLGSAAALVDLLERVWLDRIARPEATAELRRIMGAQVFTQRLSADLRADSVRVSGKTGTYLHLRHEIGVVETDSGDRIAIAALTRTDRRASIAPDVDLAIGAAARAAFEALRI
ncbi:serine hydrolase [Sciscionella sediminilitoris]|uniref:serine hydrolase n=1 Tax=Sciscionella sediminilitoris TaxID=1445613 RepID=UPI0004DF50F1|nr:serine hydrolase [Sciscionella sp. SE31]